MHGEQQEWIQKYHDQINKMTKLEALHKQNLQDKDDKYQILYVKYVEQDQALIKYKKEVEYLKSQRMNADNKSEEANQQLEKQNREMRNMERMMDAQKDVLNDFNQTRDEL